MYLRHARACSSRAANRNSHPSSTVKVLARPTHTGEGHFHSLKIPHNLSHSHSHIHGISWQPCPTYFSSNTPFYIAALKSRSPSLVRKTQWESGTLEPQSIFLPTVHEGIVSGRSTKHTHTGQKKQPSVKHQNRPWHPSHPKQSFQGIRFAQ